MEKLGPYPVDVVAVGDVIRSPLFTKGQPLPIPKSGQRWIWVGEKLPTSSSETDPSRGKSLFVVEEVNYKAAERFGGTLVTACRLNPDETYNPKGERIRFYLKGTVAYVVKQVELVGTMKRIFV